MIQTAKECNRYSEEGGKQAARKCAVIGHETMTFLWQMSGWNVAQSVGGFAVIGRHSCQSRITANGTSSDIGLQFEFGCGVGRVKRKCFGVIIKQR